MHVLLACIAVIWTYWNHENADHLRRLGSGESVFRFGDWLDPWYERLHGEELIGRAAELGVDCVYIHYFKGFGMEHERADMLRTKEFVEKAHARGVKVLGYCQMNSLYYETMLRECPDLENWCCRDEHGKIGTYGSSYYRWSPCFESREFAAYYRNVIRYGLEEIHLDGFHFDNSYPRSCWCDRCQRAFRRFLASTVKDPRRACGLADFENVRIPPFAELEEAFPDRHDPLQIWLTRFRKAQQARFHREIFDYVKSFGADKITLHNPAFARKEYERSGVDVALTPASCDYLLAENPRYIRFENGRLVSQILSYKLGRRFGFKVFDSTWPKKPAAEGAEPVTVIPDEEDVMTRYYAQAMIYGDIVGSPWLVRSKKSGDRVHLDDAVQHETARRVFRFFREHEAELYDTKTVARVHLLYDVDDFCGEAFGAKGFMSFADASERLNSGGVPYDIVNRDDLAAIGSGDVLVLPSLKFLSDGLYAAIKAADDRGALILPTEGAGVFNEIGWAREKTNPVVGLREIRNRISEVPPGWRLRSSVPNILAETQINRKNDGILHLMRADNGNVVDELTVEFASPVCRGRPVLRSFDPGCGLLRFSEADGRWRLVIRNFKTMASILFEQDGGNSCQQRDRE